MIDEDLKNKLILDYKFLFQCIEYLCELTLSRREEDEEGYGLNRLDEEFLVNVYGKMQDNDIISKKQLYFTRKIVFKYKKQLLKSMEDNNGK